MSNPDCPTCGEVVYNIRGAIKDIVALKTRIRELEEEVQHLKDEILEMSEMYDV